MDISEKQCRDAKFERKRIMSVSRQRRLVSPVRIMSVSRRRHKREPEGRGQGGQGRGVCNSNRIAIGMVDILIPKGF